MSYRIEKNNISLVCSECGSSLSKRIELSDLATMRELWSKAQKKGWTSTSEKHFCKKCSK